MAEPLPACIGNYCSPTPPVGSCTLCEYRAICKHIAKNFVPKKKLEPIIRKLETIKNSLKV